MNPNITFKVCGPDTLGCAMIMNESAGSLSFIYKYILIFPNFVVFYKINPDER